MRKERIFSLFLMDDEVLVEGEPCGAMEGWWVVTDLAFRADELSHLDDYQVQSGVAGLAFLVVSWGGVAGQWLQFKCLEMLLDT